MSEYKIIIQGPEGKQKIDADAYLLVAQTKGGSRRNLNIDSKTYAGLDEDAVAATQTLHSLAEQLDNVVPILEARLEDETPAVETSDEPVDEVEDLED